MSSKQAFVQQRGPKKQPENGGCPSFSVDLERTAQGTQTGSPSWRGAPHPHRAALPSCPLPTTRFITFRVMLLPLFICSLRTVASPCEGKAVCACFSAASTRLTGRSAWSGLPDEPSGDWMDELASFLQVLDQPRVSAFFPWNTGDTSARYLLLL